MCRGARENEVCTHNVSTLTWKTKCNFTPVHSSVTSSPNKIKLVEMLSYRGRIHTTFQINCLSHSRDMSLQTVIYFFLSLFFPHTCKIKHKRVVGLPSNLAQGASWYQIWFKCKQNWQSYKWFSQKMTFHEPTELTAYHKSWKLASDHSTQTFWGLIEMRETVTEYWYH